MKKLFYVMAIVFISIGLSGCDLISQDQVDQISEEFCRDNPESEVCQGDAVGELEDEIILNVFNTILDEYNDAANETFCDDYFSVTNTELLDSCRESREGLVPDDYVGYTVSSVSKKSTLSTSDVYEITVVSEDLTIEIVFTVGLVHVEGIMYINSWSWDSSATSPEEQDVSLEDARAYYEQFIADYLNEELSSEDVCSQYFGDRVAECIYDRDNSFSVNFTVLLNDMVPGEEPGIFEVEMAFDDDEMAEVKIEFEKVKFVYDEDGEIVMTFVHDDEGPHDDKWLNAEEAFPVIAQFLFDYNGTDISSEIFNYLYFDNQMHEQFFIERYLEVDKGVILSLVMVEDPTEEPFDYLVVTMQREFEGEIKTMIVNMRVNDLGDGRYYFDLLFGDDQRLDYDMLWNFMLDMIVDYQDVALSDVDVCSMYFGDKGLDDCVEHRQEQLDSGATISLFGLYEMNDYYEIEFEYTDGVDTWTERMFANFYFDEDNNLRVEFSELGFDEIDYYFALLFMQDLVAQYSDWELSSYDVCIQFFEGYSYDECVMRREQEIDEGVILSGFELIQEGYGFKVDYYYIDSNDNSFTKRMNAHFYYNHEGNLRLEFFEDFGLIPYEEVKQFLDRLVGDFNNWGMTNEEVCNIYFGPESVPGCAEKREEMSVGAVVIELSMLIEEYDHYRVEFRYWDGQGNEWYEGVNAFFWYDEFNNLKVDFHGDNYNEFPYDEAYNYMQQMLYDFTDQDMPEIDFCNIYFPGSGENCLWDRAILPLEHMEVWMEWMNSDGYMFEAQITFKNNYNGEIWSTNAYIEFFYDEYGNVGMHYNFNPVDDYSNYNDSYAIIQQFINDYNNPGITFEQINAWYFDYQMDWNFQEDRMEQFNEGLSIVLFEVHDPRNGNGQEFLEVILDVYRQGVYEETMTAWMRVLPLGSGYHLIEFEEDNKQDHVRISYDEAFNFLTQFSEEYSDFGIPSYDVCSMYFGVDEFPMCMAERDQEMNDGIHVQFERLDEFDDGFYASFGYYNDFGDFLFEDYTQIFFFYGERGELKISMNNHSFPDVFPYDLAFQYVADMLGQFGDPSMPTAEYCAMYGHIIPDCENTRNEVIAGGGMAWPSQFWHEYDNVFYFQFGIQLDGDVPDSIFHHGRIFFSGDIDIMTDFEYFGSFGYANAVEAEVIYNQYVLDYLNPAIPTQEIVDIYFEGMMEPNFYEDRDRDLYSGIVVGSLVVSDPNSGNGMDWLHSVLQITKNGEPETIEENFRVLVYGVDSYSIEFDRYVPDIVDYPIAYDFYSDYIDELLTPDIYTPDFCDSYNEGWMHDECTWKRDEMLGKYSYAVIVDFFFDDYQDMYQSTVEYFDADGMFMESISYDVFFWFDYEDNLKLEAFEKHGGYDPLFDELWEMMMNYPMDYTDLTISSVDFCNEYFMGDPDCVTMRDELRTSAQLYVSVDEFYWYQDCDETGYCSDEMLYEARIYYDLGDGNFLQQRVRVNPYYSPEGYLRVDLVVTEIQRSVPGDAVMLTEAETFIALTAFALDYADPTISDNAFCDMYFGGAQGCMKDRQEFIAMGGTALFNGMVEETDFEGVIFYLAEFILTLDAIPETQPAPFRVWRLIDDTYFIEFVEYYLPVDPEDVRAATWDEALNFYNNYLEDYHNPVDYSDEYLCQVYYQEFDNTFNCVEGRQEYNDDDLQSYVFSMMEHIEGDDIWYEIIIEEFDPATEVSIQYIVEVYIYVTPEGDMFMFPLAP